MYEVMLTSKKEKSHLRFFCLFVTQEKDATFRVSLQKVYITRIMR